MKKILILALIITPFLAFAQFFPKGLHTNDSLLYLKTLNGNNVEALNVARFSTNGATNTGIMRINTNIAAGSATMIDLDIAGYNYTTEAAWSGKIGTYTYNGAASPIFVNSNSVGNRNLNVRAYNNAGKVSFLIGDSLQTWQYPRISVTRVRASHISAHITQLQGWTIDFINSAANITNFPNLSPIFGWGLPPKSQTDVSASIGDTLTPTAPMPEFLAGNKTQGVAIAYDGLIRTGTNVSQDFHFRQKGQGNYAFQFLDSNSPSFIYRNYKTPANNQVYYQRYFFGRSPQLETHRYSMIYDDTLSTFRKASMYFGVINGLGGISNGMRLMTSRVAANQASYLSLENILQNKRIVLWDGLQTSDNKFYGFGVNGGLLRYQIPNSIDRHGFFAALTDSTSVEVMRIQGDGNVGVGTGTSAATSKLQVIGSQAGAITTLTSATTLGVDNYRVWASGATSYLVSLPAASSCVGREYIITTTEIAKTVSSYTGLANIATNTLPINTTITLVSTGTVWKQF